MKLRGLYAITDSELTPGKELLHAAEQALAGGVSLLQYRDKSRDHRYRLDQARALQKLCTEYDVPLLINDDIDLCLAVGAAGVHLGQADTDIHQARNLLGSQSIIGITCHADLALAEQAQRAGASYVAFGRLFSSLTKPHAPAAPLDVLTRGRERLNLPIAAIGGIDAANAPQVLAAGADLLAVINYLFSSQDVTGRARELSAIFKHPY